MKISNRYRLILSDRAGISGLNREAIHGECLIDCGAVIAVRIENHRVTDRRCSYASTRAVRGIDCSPVVRVRCYTTGSSNPVEGRGVRYARQHTRHREDDDEYPSGQRTDP